MLTEKDKEWLRGRKWKIGDIELLERDLKDHKVEEPYFIKTSEDFTPVAEVKEYIKGEQCLLIY